ncbi:hypothetical protein BTN49_2820 [Candidatus Enterovibrio escicola]|uniref:Uncharacterized protein n=1 Tax=Candidatus Enterovibrio escicola TaxID=1927127 RepID=A0A2A5T0A4_9GAMM|nr:hypothetical protein BTN49_2820 [Candidatus Enterovibrio escacola]
MCPTELVACSIQPVIPTILVGYHYHSSTVYLASLLLFLHYADNE